MGWIGRRHNGIKWYVPSSRRTVWRRKGYRLVRVATQEEDDLFAAHGGVSPVLLSRLALRAKAAEPSTLEPLEPSTLVPANGPAFHGEGGAVDLAVPSPGVESIAPPEPSRKRKRSRGEA